MPPSGLAATDAFGKTASIVSMFFLDQNSQRLRKGDKMDASYKKTINVIHTDGTIAAVYFDFVFKIDGKAENRGSETWQLVKAVGGWRIAAMTAAPMPIKHPFRKVLKQAVPVRDDGPERAKP